MPVGCSVGTPGALNMAAALASTPSTGLRVQACGDCHLLNFGAFATPERREIFRINDFDETLPLDASSGRSRENSCFSSIRDCWALGRSWLGRRLTPRI